MGFTRSALCGTQSGVRGARGAPMLGRCVFRPKWSAHFGGSGSLIPVEVDHRFRRKWIAFGRCGSLPEEGDHPQSAGRESSSVA